MLLFAASIENASLYYSDSAGLHCLKSTFWSNEGPVFLRSPYICSLESKGWPSVCLRILAELRVRGPFSVICGPMSLLVFLNHLFFSHDSTGTEWSSFEPKIVERFVHVWVRGRLANRLIRVSHHMLDLYSVIFINTPHPQTSAGLGLPDVLCLFTMQLKAFNFRVYC